MRIVFFTMFFLSSLWIACIYGWKAGIAHEQALAEIAVKQAEEREINAYKSADRSFQAWDHCRKARDEEQK